MVYELRKYNSFNSFSDEDDLGVIAWETEEFIDEDNMHFCGKLILHGTNEETVVIPDGIETLGYSFLVPHYWGGWGSSAKSVHIPASVKKIEEGAFACTDVNNIVIDPESPCGIVKDNGLFAKDGKTLLWVLGYNNETEDACEYIVPNGVERIGIDFHNDDLFDVLVVPNSVTQIGYNEDYAWLFDDVTIRAPKGSYAIDFAKEHGIEFDEID